MYSYWGGRGTKQVSRRSLDIDGHGRGSALAGGFGCEGSYCSSEREEAGVGWDEMVTCMVTLPRTMGKQSSMEGSGRQQSVRGSRLAVGRGLLIAVTAEHDGWR